jgi:hypothetical protein
VVLSAGHKQHQLYSHDGGKFFFCEIKWWQVLVRRRQQMYKATHILPDVY